MKRRHNKWPIRQRKMVYGYTNGILFITKAPSIAAFILRDLIIGRYNLKAKKAWEKRISKYK